MKKQRLSFFILRLRQQKHYLAPQETSAPIQPLTPTMPLWPKPNSTSPWLRLQSNNRSSCRGKGLLPLWFFSWLYRATSLDLKFLCLQSTRPPVCAHCHFSKVSGSPRVSLGWQRRVGWIDRPALQSQSRVLSLPLVLGPSPSSLTHQFGAGEAGNWNTLIAGVASWSPVWFL